jgi:hypothetical protein
MSSATNRSRGIIIEKSPAEVSARKKAQRHHNFFVTVGDELVKHPP